MDYYNQKWVMKFARNNAKTWAITLGQNTFYPVPKEQVDNAWRAHEDCHKEQWRKDKLFPVKYLYELATKGYWNSPYEIEARAAAENYSHPNNKGI